MLKKLLTLLCITFVSITGLTAQYTSGASSFNLESNYSRAKYYGRDANSNQLSASYDYMMSNRMMLGGSINVEETEPVQEGVYLHFSFTPKIRYFFSTGSLPIYAFFEPTFSYRKYQLELGTDEQDFRISPVTTGLGISYFVKPQIALDAKLGLAFRYAGPEQGINNIFFSLGTKTLLYAKTTGTEDNRLAESILKKGNFSFGGNLMFRRHYISEGYLYDSGIVGFKGKYNQFYINPRASYFISDHFELSTFFGFNGYSGKESSRRRRSADYDLEYEIQWTYYIRIIPHLYIKPSMGIKKRNETLGAFSDKTFTIPIELSLAYFKKHRTYFVGTRYSKRPDDSLLDTYNFFGGISYLVRKDVMITGRLDYYTSKKDILPYLGPPNYSLNRNLSFSFVLNYWIL